jgi:hypothetical protein
LKELVELENRIRILEDLEAIKNLKSKYWYYVDNKMWYELADTFTEEVFMELPKKKIQGKQSLIGEIEKSFEEVVTIHQGYAIQIDITGETTASGLWAFNDFLVYRRAEKLYKGWGYYYDEYAKEKSKWRIKSSKLTRHYSDMQSK